ncbi:hypothetical protein GWA97_11175 [Flavobacterium sp. LaA7.5]|nr:hypothetical protein [Flavobacterium salilacus subsp. altitudinum]
MNRLVIIGNGFDLAHGLPTSYKHFINWYWSKIPDTNHQDDFIKFDNGTIHTFSEISCYSDIKEQLKNGLSSDKKGLYYEFRGTHNHNSSTNEYRKEYLLEFKNTFFGTVCNKHIQNWVDIENEYYLLLKDCLKEKDNKKVKKLNEEFDQVKNLLEEYLTTEVEDKFELSPNIKIEEILSKAPHDLTMIKREIEKPNSRSFRKATDVVTPDKALLLSFNYTNLIQKYLSSLEKIQIHGRLNNNENPIIFGFGDEMDDDYKAIEKKDDNEYLRNIKSFAYLNTPNYKNLIDFLDLKKFQVYIMGHSCGLSDRILLNTIFEHQNCISIKIYYYQNEKGDNYTDIAQNVSRHFNKKEMMRGRIVNKTYCEPLPQTKLALKDTPANSV